MGCARVRESDHWITRVQRGEGRFDRQIDHRQVRVQSCIGLLEKRFTTSVLDLLVADRGFPFAVALFRVVLIEQMHQFLR